MLDFLHDVFGWVCGQGLAHTWSPGGELLPVCQRCTGVYVGAFVAVLLHWARRPVPTTPWLWLNGAFLLFIIPSGFYWIPQNPELRCASGILFGFGLVSYLSLTWPRRTGADGGGVLGQTNDSAAPALRWAAERRVAGITRMSETWLRVGCLLRRQTWTQRDHHQQNSRLQGFAIASTLLVTLALAPWLAEGGGTIGAAILIFTCVGGALTLAMLVASNLFFLLRWLTRPRQASA